MLELQVLWFSSPATLECTVISVRRLSADPTANPIVDPELIVRRIWEVISLGALQPQELIGATESYD